MDIKHLREIITKIYLKSKPTDYIPETYSYKCGEYNAYQTVVDIIDNDIKQ